MTTLTSRPFGYTAAGEAVTAYTLRNTAGMTAEILTYGGILSRLCVPLTDGSLRDVVLGCDTLADYEAQTYYLGALIGRVANRIGGGRFRLYDTEYTLFVNNGPNCNHGGRCGFDRKVWHADPLEDGSLRLRLDSPDGDEGFPGALSVTVTYTLTDDNTLRLTYRARADRETPINLTNHSYFNLNGHGTALTHRLTLFADQMTENDQNSLPTGHRLPVEGTPFDFRTPHTLGERIGATHQQLLWGVGYDHNYILKPDHSPALLRAAVLETGDLSMECWTTQPGVQLYTANWLDDQPGKNGAVYHKRDAVCLETQNWPDGIHHADFPRSTLRPDETYQQTTEYRFTAL